MRRLFAHGQLRFFGDCIPLHEDKRFASFLRKLYRQDWVVYAKPPFGGPMHVLHYLARYTHRVAISNHRLLSVSASEVHFRWKDYAHGSKQRTMTLTSKEFLRRFVQHVLPRGFPRIRYFGWLSNRMRTRILPLCRARLSCARLSVLYAEFLPIPVGDFPHGRSRLLGQMGIPVEAEFPYAGVSVIFCPLSQMSFFAIWKYPATALSMSSGRDLPRNGIDLVWQMVSARFQRAKGPMEQGWLRVVFNTPDLKAAY